MSRIFSQIYYLLLFCSGYYWAYVWLNELSTEGIKKYLLFAGFLNYVPVPAYLFPLLGLLFFVFCLLCVLSPAVKAFKRFEPYFKILTAMLYCLNISILFSYYEHIIIHHHCWMLSCCIMCFHCSNKTLNSKANLLALNLNQSILLINYFISSLWRIRSYTHSESSFLDIVMDYIGYGLAGARAEPSFLLQILLDKPYFLAFSFVCVTMFQLSCLIPAFLNSRRLFVLYGALLIGFHLATGITVGVYWLFSIPSILFFLIVAETLKKEERKLLLRQRS